MRAREAQGRRTDVAQAVILSLRETLAWMAEHGSIVDPNASDFVVKTTSEGELELWHRGRRMPVLPQPLQEVLGAADVALEPGQMLLADRGFARRIIEESLVRYSLEEFRLREIKSALLRTLEGVPDLRHSDIGPD